MSAGPLKDGGEEPSPAALKKASKWTWGSKPKASPPAKTSAPTPAKGAAPKGESPFVLKYRAFCYRVLGRRLDLRSEGSKEIDPLVERLKQEGVHVSPGLHRAVVLLTTIFAVVGVTAGTLVLFGIIIQPSSWILYVLGIVGLTALAVPATFAFLGRARTSNRSTELDRELPFTLSELSVMASTGMSPIDLVHRMARRNRDPAMTAEFKTVVYKTDVQGKDLITALSETAKESPSEALRETFWGLANIIHQGGNLDEYLRNKSNDILWIKREGQEAFIERLTTYVDMYISLILIGVLMIVVGAFLINAFGQTALGLDSNALLLLLTFGLVPLSVVITVIMVMVAYARSE